MSKKKKEQIEEKRPDASPIGHHGTVEQLYAADADAKADIEAKRALHLLNARKSKDGMSLFHSLRKYQRLRDAYREAQQVPYEIHKELYAGAIRAFKEGNDENLQTILADPESFRRSKWYTESDTPRSTLLDLMTDNPDPNVAHRALAKIAEEEKQEILDKALHYLVSSYSIVKEETVAALLKAGAKAEASVLAAAIDGAADGDRNVPQSIQDLFFQRGLTYDDALKEMREKPGYYSSGAADRLELALMKEQITQLEGKITGQPTAALPAAQPAPAAQDTAPPAPVEKEPAPQVPIAEEPAKAVAAEKKEEVPATSYPAIDPLRRRFRATTRSSADQPAQQPATPDQETSQPAPAAGSTLPVNPRRPRFRAIR